MVLATLAGLGHGLHGREMIEDRGILPSLMSGLVLAMVYTSGWLILRTILTKFIDLSRPTVMVGYLGGMLLVGAVVVNAINGDSTYMRDYRFVAVTTVVWSAVTVGGLPGMLLGQLVAWIRDARHAKTAPVTEQVPAPQPPQDTVPARPAPAPPMPLIGEPNPRGPLDDVLGVSDANDRRTDPQTW